MRTHLWTSWARIALQHETMTTAAREELEQAAPENRNGYMLQNEADAALEVTRPVCDRPSRRRPGGTRVYRATTPTAPGRVTAAPGDRIGLAEQIAADLLPEAGDSRAVEAKEGL